MTAPQTSFGQLVIGPPGSGKTTFCHGIEQILKQFDRKVSIINLDPGNDILPYECAVDVKELITVEDVMEDLNLGPNAAFIYCMEFLETNLEWFRDKLTPLRNTYLVFDCPGQTELFTHHKSLKNIMETLNQKWDIRLCAVHLVDSHYCSDPGTFISVVLTSLNAMSQIELPFVHVLSKVDLIDKDKKLLFNLDYYAEVLDLSYMWENIANDPFFKNYKKLNKVLAECIEGYSLVNFTPLNIQDKENVCFVIQRIDKSNGYIFTTQEFPHRASYFPSTNNELYDTTTFPDNYVDTSDDVSQTENKTQ